jgi:hypothetical protein
MIKVLRTIRRTLEEIKFLFFNTFYLRQLLLFLLWWLIIMIILLFLPLLGAFSFILHVYLAAPYAFDDILITYKKVILTT